jgi:hypothetical protein
VRGLSVAELQAMARDVFGRGLSPAQAERYRGRLPVMAQAAQAIQDWERRLGDTGPAAVHRTPLKHESAYAAVEPRVQ